MLKCETLPQNQETVGVFFFFLSAAGDPDVP